VGVETYRFAESGGIPNNPVLPALRYPGALAGATPADVEARLAANGWGGMWRNGVYAFHHFHSTAHEALVVARGRVRVMLGGPGGRELVLGAGDVAVLPAGTGHLNLEQADLLVVGAYPPGQVPDLLRDDPAGLSAARARIAAVPLPLTDPVHGADGPLTRLWTAHGAAPS
jgi:uncharacterized protein YjlB